MTISRDKAIETIGELAVGQLEGKQLIVVDQQRYEDLESLLVLTEHWLRNPRSYFYDIIDLLKKLTGRK